MGLFGSKSLKSVAKHPSLSVLVKTSRILVIDDNPAEFPFEILRREGYSIDHWYDVKELQKLENGFYDIVVLDIGGVAKDFDPKNEGAGLLNHIKSVNPSQIVVAYSGQSHEPSRISFFKLADQWVPKPTNAFTWKETLDDLLQNKSTVDHYWSTVKDMLEKSGATQRQIDKLEKELVRVVQGKSSASASEIVARTIGVADKVTTVISVLGKIITIATLLA